MTQPQNRLLDEFAKLMTDAAGMAQGARREVEGVMRSQAERFLSDMDLVTRDEFEVVKAMAAKARAENDALRGELEALRAMVEKPTAKPATKRKAAPKKD